LVIQQDGVPYKEPVAIDLSFVWLASRQPKETPLAFQFWMIGQHSKTNPSTARDYYRAAKCLMITRSSKIEMPMESLWVGGKPTTQNLNLWQPALCKVHHPVVSPIADFSRYQPLTDSFGCCTH